MNNVTPYKHPFHASMQHAARWKPKPFFSLHWSTTQGKIMTISCSDAGQILRQLKSLADRSIAASVYQGKDIVAATVPAPNKFQTILIGDALTK